MRTLVFCGRTLALRVVPKGDGHAVRITSGGCPTRFLVGTAEKIGIGFELPGCSSGEKLAKTPSVGQLGQLIQFRKTGSVVWNLVDERGFEPPASSLRTRRSPS